MNPGDSVVAVTTMLSVTAAAATATTSSSSTTTDGVSASDCTRITTSGCSDATRVTTSGGGIGGGGGGGGQSGVAMVADNQRRPQRVHPAAMALRLRVTQVVCGILTCVLGTVALIEERASELRLSSGLVAGAATVVASVASIYATFDSVGGSIYYDRARWITQHGSGTSSSSDTDRTSCVLSSLWALAVITNLAMLAFAAMVFGAPASTRNLIVIGSLELGFGVSVLVILGVNLCLALHYKEQLMRKN